MCCPPWTSYKAYTGTSDEADCAFPLGLSRAITKENFLMKLIKLAILGFAFATVVPAVSFAQSNVGLQLPGVTTTVSTTAGTSTTVTTTMATSSTGTNSGSNENNNNSNNGSNNNSNDNRNLTCSPSLQTVETGTTAAVRLSGGNGTYSLSAPGYTVINTDNNRYSFTYKTPGRKSIVATSGSQQATCVIEVTGASLLPAGASEADQVVVIADTVADTEESKPMTWWPWILVVLVAVAAIVALARSRSSKA